MSELSEKLDLAEKLCDSAIYFVVGLPNEAELRIVIVERKMMERVADQMENESLTDLPVEEARLKLRRYIDFCLSEFDDVVSVLAVAATHALMTREPAADPNELAHYRYGALIRDRGRLRVGCEIERARFEAEIAPVVADRSGVILSPDEWEAARAVKH